MATSNKQSKEKNKTKRKIEDTLDEVAERFEGKAIKTYDALIDRLKYERDNLEREARHEYRNARRYVRANPEQGVGIAFVAGLVIGALIAGGSRR